jgi:hypothetical protein
MTAEPRPWCPVCGLLPPDSDEAQHHADVHGCATLLIERETPPREVRRRRELSPEQVARLRAAGAETAVKSCAEQGVPLDAPPEVMRLLAEQIEASRRRREAGR